MKPSVIARSGTVVSSVTLLLCSTACVDIAHFSRTATDFNNEVADTQDKTLILNIVRAANRFPMHFTELSTLSGTATLSVGGTITVPVGILNGGMNTGSVAPTVSETSTPTFNIAVLETQEFYQGMLKALSMDELATYMNEGLPADLVLSLSVSQFIYQDAPGAQPKTIENSFRRLKAVNRELCADSIDPSADASEYECFRGILSALLDLRLTTETVKTTTNIGAPVLASSFSDLRWLNGFDARTLKIASIDAEDCKFKSSLCPEGYDALPADQQAALSKKQVLYRIQKDSSDSRFCLNHAFEPYDPTRRKASVPGAEEGG